MLFNSFQFILIFLPATIIIYFLLNTNRLVLAGKAWLVLASLFFYSYWNVKYLALILFSIAVNYGIGTILIEYPKIRISRKGILYIGIIFNVLLLGYYKYTDFIIGNINFLTGANLGLQHIVLPLAISFFTFTQIAYLVDSYKMEVKERDFLNYCFFVSFFSHLIAGPIVHHREMMPQFSRLRSKVFNWKNFMPGLFLFAIGLFKKVVLADTLAPWANTGFDNAESLSFLPAWVASLSYTFQIYFDFSGYSDMALGTAAMFNVELPINFNSPYKAVNIQDHWQRWHMTLSRFLRDYIYIPLGGNRFGESKAIKNVLITFLIGGLWHGAGWTYVIWGAMHGVASIIHRLWKRLNISMPRLLAWFITFNFVNLCMTVFKATSIKNALDVLAGMFGFHSFVFPKFMEGFFEALHIQGVSYGSYIREVNGDFYLTPLYLLVSAMIIFLAPNGNELRKRFKPHFLYILLTAALLFFSLSFILSSRYSSEFIYFNF